MTTIATDGKSMAGDGVRLHFDTIITTNARKVCRMQDGRIVGTAGDVAFGLAMVEWLGSDEAKPDLPSGSEGTILILHPGGSASVIDKHGKEIPVMLPCAIGSGADIALGAMLAGASPAEALEIAISRDTGSGGTITVEALDAA